MNIKELYRRFRDWQITPVTFKRESKTSNICANCGTAFEGDYCPICGQKYDVGRINWRTVIRDFADTFGKKSRSAVTFMIHMIARPGYLVSDYLNGRRQICAKPLRVICFLVVSVLLVQKWTGNGGAEDVVSAAGGQGVMGFIKGWLSSHMDWAVIIQTALLVIPTWLLFRFSPKNSRHTIPEGIYIQLFMGSLVLLVIALRALLGDWVLVLVPIFYCIAYRQLFGYGIWGTIWRTLLCFGILLYYFGIAMCVSLRLSGEFWARHSAWEFISMFLAFLILGAAIMYLGYKISEKTSTTLNGNNYKSIH